jgi:multisubunit Na+/H+ antiporter MnhC subunit
MMDLHSLAPIHYNAISLLAFILVMRFSPGPGIPTPAKAVMTLNAFFLVVLAVALMNNHDTYQGQKQNQIQERGLSRFMNLFATLAIYVFPLAAALYLQWHKSITCDNFVKMAIVPVLAVLLYYSLTINPNQKEGPVTKSDPRDALPHALVMYALVIGVLFYVLRGC